MKKLSFFLMAMLISVMGFAADVTMAAGENGSACTVNGTDGIKVGTSKKGGDMTITVPGGATELSFYAAAWKGVTNLSINITPTDNVLTSSIALTDDAGLSNNTPFTLSGNEADYLYTITLQNVEQETTFKLTSSTTKRFVVWGATCTVGSSADFVAAPSIAGDVDFVESTTISITALDGLAIYYTVDGTDPTNESAAYTAPFEVTETTTVKAIAYNGDNASAIAEKTFKKLQVLTCADAAALCSATETTEKYVVRGYVTELLNGGYSESYKNSSFWMADTKDGGKVLEAYAVDPILESDIQVKVGDYVEVIGKLVLYGSSNIPEVNRGTYTIIPEPAPEPVMFTVTATAENGTVEGAGEYEEGKEATLTATAAEGYEFVNWTSGETEVSTANPFTFTVTSDTTLVANFKEVEPVKLYLNAKDWGYGDARFAAYFFDPAKWVDMTKVDGEAYIYEVEVPAGYTQVIFVRMNGTTTENNWNNKWNQTGNLTIPTDGKNMFKPDDWNNKTTTWSTYIPSVKYTFTEGSTWYIDFSAITGKKGANYPKADVADIDYSTNAGGTVIPVTFTANVTWAEGATFIKTEEGGWDALTFTTPTEGANCAQVAADGKSYTWTTYAPVVTYDVTVADATVTTGQSLTFMGSWEGKAIAISLWQGGATQGFGTYAIEDVNEGAMIGTTTITPTTPVTYSDNGDGTFTFKGTFTDADGAIYNISVTGAIPATVEPETVEIEATAEFADNGEGSLYIDVCEENWAWCVQLTVWDCDGSAGEYEISGLYSTDNDYNVSGTATIAYDEYAETDVLTATLKTADESLTVLVTLYKKAGSTSVEGTPMELNVTDLVVEYETLAFTGTADFFTISLVPNTEKPIEGKDMTFELDLDKSSIQMNMGLRPTPLTLISGEITVDMGAPAANATVTASIEDQTYLLTINMTAATGEAIELYLDATSVVVDEDLEVLTLYSTYTDEEGTTFPVAIELQSFENVAYKEYAAEEICKITIGDMESENEEDFLDIAFASEVAVTIGEEGEGSIYLEGEFSSWNTGESYYVEISGTLPSVGADLENIDATASLVKMIQNGQFVIIKNGVQYNAQGATLK